MVFEDQKTLNHFVTATYNSRNPTDGLLHYLFIKNRNWYFENIKTNATSIYEIENHNQNFDSKNAIDFDDDKYWTSKEIDDEEQFWELQLPFPINITSYVIQSWEGSCHPKSWGFAASNDGITFENRENYTDEDNSMNFSYSHANIEYNYGFYQYFRLYVTNISYCDNKRFDLNQFELYGSMNLTEPFQYLTCSYPTSPRIHLLSYAIFLYTEI